MSTKFTIALGLLVAGLTGRAALAQPEADLAAKEFIEAHLATVRPLEIAAAKAWWEANTTGQDEAFAAKEAAEIRLNETLGSPDRFQRLQSIRRGTLTDSLVRRQIEILYLQYLDKQVDVNLLKRMTSKANAIEKAFNVYRAQVGDESLSDSQVRKVLLKSRDSAARRQVWEASKQVGSQVVADLRELVYLRNEAAHKAGFENYHVMQLYLNEQDQQEVLRLFDELDDLTREPFARAKQQIDQRLAEQYQIALADLRPWHYHDPFFQEPPAVYDVDLDAPFADADILRICREFYAGIGLPIDDVIARSDLYEKPGKSPHAFCTDIDRAGDVRVLANIVPNEYWMTTMLHELGHAVYSSKNIPASVPYTLRNAAHILTTEGVAMMFERFATNAEWLRAYSLPVADGEALTEAGRRMRRDKLLIFSRWCQVMLRFEVELYRRPDQDLNKLWWDLVEKYQMLKRPEGRDQPDFASKIHVVSAPCYYHNYMMGELFACQLHAAIIEQGLGRSGAPTAIYTRDPRVGRFMQDRVFSQGQIRPWNDLTEFATGAKLNAKAFAAEFGK